MTKYPRQSCYTSKTILILGGIKMEFAKMVRPSLINRQETAIARGAKMQLNKYIVSQFFIQLVNFQQLIASMNEFVGNGKLIKTATSFDGLSLCLNKMMSQMLHDRFDVEAQEQLVCSTLKKLEITTRDIQIKSLYPRLLKISMIVEKPSATLLSGELKNELEALFGESLKIKIGKVRNKTMQIEVSSSRNFKVAHGVAYIGKNADKVSGDSYLCENFPNGKTVVAISDGMGNGQTAKTESSRALRVLKCMMNFDVPVTEVVRVLSELKQDSNIEERFFSLDLCVVDKEKGRAHFYKQAATTTFILRDEKVYRIEMSGLPIGAVDATDIDELTIDLQPHDVIIMCSDGILDSFDNIELFEQRIIKNCHQDVQQMTQDLLNYTIKRTNGEIKDDMMIVAANYTPTKRHQL